ncbi:LysR family transcriptional regulator [Ramlibacter tataouinensis]|uniref:Transcriptional regulator, LysR family-like protein n=1 Tax=Ramlibacter tataouinensis (strain ATCC BAA-407 / DSM 14655 / LMG 21543 / TTB310) TaxID=365046 RepID=F5XYT8_RAMTT|nr:LysR family transcriptional regulator [Ramlibacter tataouinensis]AEG94455.1 transcriptional regulator, LysR family-like protein [Ramlibacter tataouinensis TTB310]
MDTQFLQSFVMVVDAGSMAEAARRLDLTPAAVAARVKSLEEAMGTTLVRRAGRTVKATEAGLRILSHARGVLRDLRDLHALANDDAPLGEWRLGVSTSALTGVVPPLLRGMYGKHPKLAVYMEPGNSGTLYQRVTGGMLDAAVIVEPQFTLPKSCGWQVLVDEPLCVLAPGALAGRDPLALLASEPFIRYDRTMWGGRLADSYLREHQIQPQERIEIDALNAIAVFVHQGLGVSLVPDWTPPWPEGLEVVRIPLPPPVPVRRMGLVWTEGPKAALARALLAEAEKVWGPSSAPA